MRIGSVKVAITTTQVRESLVTYFDNQLKPFMLVNLAFDAIFYLQRHFPHHKWCAVYTIHLRLNIVLVEQAVDVV